MASVEWLTEQIKRQEIELAKLKADFEADKDLTPVLQKIELIWGVKEHLLHLNVHKIVAEAVDKFGSTVLDMQQNVKTELCRLETLVNEVYEFAHKSEEIITKQIAMQTDGTSLRTQTTPVYSKRASCSSREVHLWTLSKCQRSTEVHWRCG